MNADRFTAWAVFILATAMAAGCNSNQATDDTAPMSPASICRYEVQSGVEGGEVVAALAPYGGYSCAFGDSVSAFVSTNAPECPALPIKTTAVLRIGLAEGARILRACNALSSPETPRSGDVLLVRASSANAIEELEGAALRGGYFITYYLRQSELHCFEVADDEKARAAGLSRLVERFAVPDGLTWTNGTCRQAVRNTYDRDFSWRAGE